MQLAQRLVPGQKGREQVHLQRLQNQQQALAPEQLLLVPVPVPEEHCQRHQNPEGRVQAQPELEPEPGPFWVAQQPLAEGPPPRQ